MFENRRVLLSITLDCAFNVNKIQLAAHSFYISSCLLYSEQNRKKLKAEKRHSRNRKLDNEKL